MMLAHSPQLETLVLGEESDVISRDLPTPTYWFSTPPSRLTSLTLFNPTLNINELLSAVSNTRSLRHLKIVTSSLDIINGSRWEELIKTELPALNKFEFYTRGVRCRSEKETAESLLNETIFPFRMPFWTEEKRWLVICDFFPTEEKLEMYTSPICTSCSVHLPDPTMHTICNFEREKDQH
jgi:hypothetical protein